jgi:hypothetical protein
MERSAVPERTVRERRTSKSPQSSDAPRDKQ